MRNLIASLLIAVSALAHAFWRAGSKLHHVFGAILLLSTAAVILPVSIARRLTGKAKTGTNDNDNDNDNDE